MQTTVLIIDDNEDDVMLTKRVLLRIEPELRVEAALSGEEGLTLLRNARELPALVLLDLKMPGMSGFDVLGRMRREENLKDVPVVVVTSSFLESDEKESFSVGANGFLHKSADIDRFSIRIKSFLKRCLKS